MEDRIGNRWALAIALITWGILLKCCVESAHADSIETRIEAPPLADRAMAWAKQQRGARNGAHRFGMRVRQGWPGEDWVRSSLVPAAVEAAQGAVFPERWPDAELLLAKSWWESVWNPNAVGRFIVVAGQVIPGHGGELGVMQIKPHICRRYLHPGESCADTPVNLRIAATILREHLATCDGRPRYALRFYATGSGCGRPRYPEKTVTRWAQQIREQRWP